MTIKIVTVLGARPQFIKASVVSRAFDAAHETFSEIVVHTGQHFDADMSDVFFSGLKCANQNTILEFMAAAMVQ